jgi:hypothetical protein
MRKPKTKAQILADPRVDQFFHDGDGWWCWLKPGYWSSNMECGTLHEDTIREVVEQFDYVEKAPLDYIKQAGYELREAQLNWAATDIANMEKIT